MDPTTNDAIDQEIDAEIDAILNEDVTSETPGASEDGTQSEGSDPLAAELKTLGLTRDIPPDLSPEVRELFAETVAKSNERVSGFQSGFDKATREIGAKAKVYDQLTSMPEFQTWLEGIRNPGASRPAAAPEPAPEPTLDFNNLPADPVKRIEVLMDFYSEKAVQKALNERLSPLEKQVSTVGAVVGSIGWQNFVASHPDAPQFKPEIDRLIARGHSAEEAYKYAKGASLDPKSIEDRVLERVKARHAKVKEASGAGLPQGSTGRGSSDAGSDLVAFAKEHGEQAAIVEAIRRAQEEAGDFSI